MDRVAVMNAGRAIQIDSPIAMYETPRTAFVSGFVGKTNLFAGTAAADRVTIDGHHITAPTEGLLDGAPVRVSIRPEKVRLAPSGEGVEARVGTVAFHGSHWLYTLHTALGNMIAVAPNTGAEPWGAGADVGLVLPREALKLLPAEEGDAGA